MRGLIRRVTRWLELDLHYVLQARLEFRDLSQPAV